MKTKPKTILSNITDSIHNIKLNEQLINKIKVESKKNKNGLLLINKKMFVN